jgi:hypothetical protein
MRFEISAAVAAMFLVACLSGCIGDFGGKGSGALDELKNPMGTPIGLDAYENMKLLPYLTYGVQAKQTSSHDRAGGNDDGFFTTYSSLYTEMSQSSFVLFDEKGPGCIYRMWMTDTTMLAGAAYPPMTVPADFTTNVLSFYFDGETSPRISMTIADFFSGSTFPFLSPLVGDQKVSSGGFYSYIPITFEKSLKIATQSIPFFYQFTYHIYPEGTPVKSFDMNVIDQNQISRIVEKWKNTGADPKDASGNIAEEFETATESGGSSIVFNFSGYGVINAIKVWPDQRDDASLENTWLEIYWDGEKKPSVRAPLGEFFGCGLGEYEMKSLPIGMIPNGYYYCYFPMPFASRATIKLVNENSKEFSAKWSIEYAEEKYEGIGTICGHFRVTWHQENPTTDAMDFQMLNAEGAGKFVGETYTMRSVGTTTRNYLEGDERIYFDGSHSPAIYGTGTEDYYNSGWYFLYGTVTLPMHGNPAHEIDNTDRTGVYRMHPFDFLPFHNSFHFGIEHGPQNDVVGNHTCVAYWYGADGSHMVLTDEIDVGDSQSEKTHNYSVQSEVSKLESTFQFEGDEDYVPITENGVSFSGSSEFTIKIDSDNIGIKLRRLTDIGSRRQEAKVIVDGKALLRHWYDPGCSPNWPFSNRGAGSPNYNDYLLFSSTDHKVRWLESEYEIPSSVTSGKDSIVVQIEYVNSDDGAWNEYHYWAYSYITG